MIGTITIETTGAIETNEFFIYSGSEKKQNKDGGDQNNRLSVRSTLFTDSLHLSTVLEYSFRNVSVSRVRNCK